MINVFGGTSPQSIRAAAERLYRETGLALDLDRIWRWQQASGQVCFGCALDGCRGGQCPLRPVCLLVAQAVKDRPKR